MIELDLRAGQPIIYVVSPEEGRAELMIVEEAQKAKRKNITFWSCTDGFIKLGATKGDENTQDPMMALNYIKENVEPESVYIFRDLHLFFENSPPALIRILRDLARECKETKRTIVLLSPVRKVPMELERDTVVVEFELPKEELLKKIFMGVYSPHKERAPLSEDDIERTIQAAKGLTTNEAEMAFSKALVSYIRDTAGGLTIPAIVMKEKAMSVKKAGILEYFESKEDESSIGGLENLKSWMKQRSKSFTKKAKEFGVPMPKGILLLGSPGCGKSLTAKAASNILKVPLIKLDIGRLFGGLVGASEQNTRNALATIDAVGDCIVWIDELEKAFAGVNGGDGDNGVSKRMFGQIITWMQEKTSPSFIVATANNISTLPSELLRKGRFDEIFFVGLPNDEERKKILEISVKKFKRDPKIITKDKMKDCISNSQGFSGAELEAAVKSGLHTAFNRGTELDGDYILREILITTPLSRSRAQQLDEMRKWAAENAVNASKTDEVKGLLGETLGGRQLTMD
jgi:SpoVK/Ycf46/Vps4 family AAA+-type ATPase